MRAASGNIAVNGLRSGLRKGLRLFGRKARNEHRDYGLLVNERHRFVAFFAPKAANRSLKSWYLRTLGLGEAVAYDDVHDFVRERHRRYSPAALRSLLRDPEIFKFAVVRSPWERALSGYLDKFVRETNRFGEPQARYPGADAVARRLSEREELWNGRPVPSISFREFIHYLAATPRHLDIHFTPQREYHRRDLGLRELSYDHVCRVESLARDFAVVLEKLDFDLPLGHDNRTAYAAPSGADFSGCGLGELNAFQRSHGAYPHPRDFFTPELVARVRERFAEDVETFGYRYDG